MENDERTASDEVFLRGCRVEVFRGPGPGGQKRNKTSSNVRMTHVSSGLQAIAGESRSQTKNRETALRRLRLRVAIELRRSIELETFKRPEWFTLDISGKNPLYPQAVGLLLDVLAACEWQTAPARELLGIGSSQFTKFLHGDPEVWKIVQRERAGRNLRPLTNN